MSKVRFNKDINFDTGVPLTIYDSKLEKRGEVSDSAIVVMPSVFVSDETEEIRVVDESFRPKQEHFTTIGIPQ